MTTVDHNALKIVNIEGPNGNFGIAPASATPDGFCFLYQDKKHSFFYYASSNFKPVWTVEVQSASTGVWAGRPVKLSHEDEEYIKANITFFFKTRRFSKPEIELKPGEGVKNVAFSWGVSDEY